MRRHPNSGTDPISDEQRAAYRLPMPVSGRAAIHHNPTFEQRFASPDTGHSFTLPLHQATNGLLLLTFSPNARRCTKAKAPAILPQKVQCSLIAKPVRLAAPSTIAAGYGVATALISDVHHRSLHAHQQSAKAAEEVRHINSIHNPGVRVRCRRKTAEHDLSTLKGGLTPGS